MKEGRLMLEALNGFLIFVNRKGSIKFVSKTIEDHLGLKQVGCTLKFKVIMPKDLSFERVHG